MVLARVILVSPFMFSLYTFPLLLSFCLHPPPEVKMRLEKEKEEELNLPFLHGHITLLKFLCVCIINLRALDSDYFFFPIILLTFLYYSSCLVLRFFLNDCVAALVAAGSIDSASALHDSRSINQVKVQMDFYVKMYKLYNKCANASNHL